MKKKILITGGTGFIGSNFIESKKDQFDFLVISRRSCISSTGIKYMKPEELNEENLKDFRPEILIHLASDSSLQSTPNVISQLLYANIEFPTLVTECFIKSGGKKILNIGSYWEHSLNKPYSPNSLYAASKKAFQDLLQYYVDQRGAEVITLKLFDTYGKNDPRRKVLRLVHEATIQGQQIELSGGDQILNLVHITDVIAAFEKALTLFSPKHQYFLVKGEGFKLKQIIEKYIAINELKANLQWGKRPYNERDSFTDIDIYPIVPEWTAKINIDQGLKDLFSP